MDNTKAKAISVIGWIDIIGGVIGSFIMGSAFSLSNLDGIEKYNWNIVILGIFSSVVSGIILLGFAEIINLLQEKVSQAKKIDEILDAIKSINNSSNNITKMNNDELPIL